MCACVSLHGAKELPLHKKRPKRNEHEADDLKVTLFSAPFLICGAAVTVRCGAP